MNRVAQARDSVARLTLELAQARHLLRVLREEEQSNKAAARREARRLREAERAQKFEGKARRRLVSSVSARGRVNSVFALGGVV